MTHKQDLRKTMRFDPKICEPPQCTDLYMRMASKFSTKHIAHRASEEGLTLIEVLVALAIIAVAFTALMIANGETIRHTQTLKDKTLKHWVAMQAVEMIQLGLIQPTAGGLSTHKSKLLNRDWYWRTEIHSTPIERIQKITITVSTNINGPFTDPLDAFRYKIQEKQ